jgi:hypothetical protein
MPGDSVLVGEKPFYKDYFSGTFNGEINLDGLAESHFKDFELYYAAYRATTFSDISQLFRRTISGKAKLWFDKTNFSTVETLKREFLKKFGKQKSQQHYVKNFYSSKLEEGEDINSYLYRLKEAGAALGVTDEGKIKDNFLRGLPSHLFALVAGGRDKSLADITSLADSHLEYFRESKGAVNFDTGDKVNSSEKYTAKTLLHEELESGLVKQVRELGQELRDLKIQLNPSGTCDSYPEQGADVDSVKVAESRGRPKYRSPHKPYRRSNSPPRGVPHDRDRYPSRDRHHSRERYPSQDRYPSRERYPSQDRYPSRDRHHNRDRYPSRDRYSSRDRYPHDRDRYPGRDSYSSRDGYPGRGRYFSQGTHYRDNDGPDSSVDGYYNRNSYPRQIRCDRCGGIGHIARRCPSQFSNQGFQ